MKILLSGYNGVMGHVVSELTSDIVAGYSNVLADASFPVYTDLSEIKEDFDVILDFSHPSALKDILNKAVSVKKPLVIAATGLDEGHHQMIDLASSHIPVLQSGNFSLGINAMLDITTALSKMLEGYDVEIIEKHHNLKVDAPSGTAEMLLGSVLEASDDRDHAVYGRHGNDAKRTASEVGVHAVRGGTIVGEHSVIFAGVDEVIEIKHTAFSKKIFAQGALKACKFMVSAKAGRYEMKDVLNHD